MGLGAGVFDGKLFSAAALMVMTTTFVAPIALRALLHPRPGGIDESPTGGTADLVSRV